MTEKSLLRQLVEISIVSLVAVPLSLIGTGIGGYIWSEKIVSRLKTDYKY